MKKLAIILFVAIMVATLPLTAFAATGINEYEQKILDKLVACQGMAIPGMDAILSQEYINAARNHFLGDGDITEEQMNSVIAYIDQAMGVVKEEANAQNKQEGEDFKLSDMDEDARKEVIGIGQAACDEVDLKLSYNAKDHHITITTSKDSTLVFETSPVIKTTGEDFPITAGSIVAGVVAVISVGMVAICFVSKKKGLFTV